ncbi:DUF2523 family protein [Enterovibrio paralichthyis]|uniref:DUF2523 family protein n=1 Tax=Enterovibrio paralichthyis TaxID=2853805 RepID=UPI001C47573D|nr:DUF2523 family protein [Enterovibrio paralichthyis]MBV7296617.1 DUF2523 domain-containing protein [Enterovibrio paralichthyis]
MKYYSPVLFLALFAVAPYSFADDQSVVTYFTDAYDWIVNVLEEISAFITGIPDFIERSVAYMIEASVLIKVKMMIHTVDFAYGVAQHILVDLSIDSLLRRAISSLPSEYQGLFGAVGLFKAINIIIEAAVTRFVLKVLGW